MDGRVSNLRQLISVTRYTLSEGEGRGLDVLDCNNGRLRFLVNLSRAGDIMQMFHEGMNLSFVSKNGFNNRSCDFLRRFEGGMLYTCGLDSVGGREGYELHGTLHLMAAELVHAEASEEGIRVELTVRDSALFGKNLVMHRTVTTALGEDVLHITDTLENRGTRDEEYCLLYHVNVGYPMLDEGAKIIADITSCEPRTPYAKQNEETLDTVSAPIDNEEESCYFLDLERPRISLVNERINKSLTLSYSKETLPEFVLWKSPAGGDYALGLEPATTKLDDLFAYRVIRKGEKISFSLSLGVNTIRD